MEILIQNIVPIVSAVVTCFIGYLFKEFKKSMDERKEEESQRIAEIKKHNVAISKAVETLCGFRLFQSYKYYIKVGGITVQELEAMSKIYEAYRDLGGNGAIEEIYHKMRKLPLKDDFLDKAISLEKSLR